MRKLRWCLLLAPLVLAACDDDGGECMPETDLQFCSRQGFECGEATGFDNCETSRTVACGMCGAGQVCLANQCSSGGLDAGDRDAGGGSDGGADGGARDAGAPDAGSCIAPNGWAEDTLPTGYVGDGYAVGDRFPEFTEVIDQNGANDVTLGQFHGAMVIVAVHATWSAPCGTMDTTAQSRLDTLNAETSDYVTTQLSILADDDTPGATASSGFATGPDATSWSMLYTTDFPVLAGRGAYQLYADAAVTALPTIYVLDPNLEIREVILGWPGDAGLLTSVRDAWSAFRAENPSWTSSYCTE